MRIDVNRLRLPSHDPVKAQEPRLFKLAVRNPLNVEFRSWRECEVEPASSKVRLRSGIGVRREGDAGVIRQPYG